MTGTANPAVERPLTERPRRLGHPGARLLAGPADAVSESLGAHLQRLGRLPRLDRDLLAVIDAAGIGGRGGGGFPVARKLGGAVTAPRGRGAAGAPLVIVNAAESEPASRKDRILCTLRPHLVLDGAAVVAAAVGAGEVPIYCHSTEVAEAMTGACAERAPEAGEPRWRVVVGPDRFVAGESTAVASFVDGGEALPRVLRAPLAVAGVSGRPTVVHNAETLGHLALLVRFGAQWWREAGTPDAPGSRLVTVTGAAGRPEAVFEVVQPVTIGAILAEAGVAGPPAGVLVGGYAGRWVAGDVAWTAPFHPAALQRIGATAGCGLLGIVPHGTCPLSETARLASYLAGQSAGQCGPCVLGLADVADLAGALAVGRARRRDVRRLRQRLLDVAGRGGCHHPDGVAAMVSSALDVFVEDVQRHVQGRPCTGAGRRPVLAVPDAVGSGS